MTATGASLVRVMGGGAVLTVDEVAAFLNVCVLRVARLLEDGVIPHDRVGAEQRVALTDVLEYRQREEAQAAAALAEFAAEAQKYDLGY